MRSDMLNPIEVTSTMARFAIHEPRARVRGYLFVEIGDLFNTVIPGLSRDGMT